MVKFRYNIAKSSYSKQTISTQFAKPPSPSGSKNEKLLRSPWLPNSCPHCNCQQCLSAAVNSGENSNAALVGDIKQHQVKKKKKGYFVLALIIFQPCEMGCIAINQKATLLAGDEVLYVGMFVLVSLTQI